MSPSICCYGKCFSLRASVVVSSLKMDSCSHVTASMFVNWMLLQFCSSFFYKEGWRMIALLETRREMEPGPWSDNPWKDKNRLLDKAGVVQGDSWKTVGTSKRACRPEEQGEWELPGGDAGLVDQRTECSPSVHEALGSSPNLINRAWRHTSVTGALRRWRQRVKSSRSSSLP